MSRLSRKTIRESSLKTAHCSGRTTSGLPVRMRKAFVGKISPLRS